MKPSPNILSLKLIGCLIRGNNLLERFSENVNHRVVAIVTNYLIDWSLDYHFFLYVNISRL